MSRIVSYIISPNIETIVFKTVEIYLKIKLYVCRISVKY